MKKLFLKFIPVFFISMLSTLNFGCSDDDNLVVQNDDPTIITFATTYGSVNAESGQSVCVTSDGGYIVAGNRRISGASELDIYVVKTDNLGGSLWVKIIGNVSNSESSYSICNVTGGGFLITGRKGQVGVAEGDVYLIKIDNRGSLVWEKTFGGGGNDVGNSVIESYTGDFLIAGRTTSFGVDSTDIYLIKTNSNGDTLWTKTYGGLGVDYSNSIKETSDGGYIITGLSTSSGAGKSDVYLLKTNSNGDSLWAKTYGGPENDWGQSVIEATSGGFVITGGTSSFGAGAIDSYLIKTNKSGDSLWTKTFGDASNDHGYSVCEADDEGYVIAGSTDTTSRNHNVTSLIKTDINGNIAWEKVIGDKEFSRGHSIVKATDGGFIIGGFTYYNGGTGDDVYLIKTDVNGIVE